MNAAVKTGAKDKFPYHPSLIPLMLFILSSHSFPTETDVAFD
jgi:hypothetical protein